MTTGGVSCSSSTNNTMGSGVILLNLDNVIDVDGTLTSWCCKANQSGYAELRVFRDDGTNYVYIGGTGSIAVVSGWNTGLSCNIPVFAGDIIGVHHNLSQPTTTGGGGHGAYRDGDTTSTLPKTSWITLDNDNIAALGATGTSSAGVYVDINKADDTGNGLSWANAKKTMNAGYSILNAGTVLHVASGDYSAQTVITYNKSWKLSCEDPNSTGTKSVKITKSA